MPLVRALDIMCSIHRRTCTEAVRHKYLSFMAHQVMSSMQSIRFELCILGFVYECYHLFL